MPDFAPDEQAESLVSLSVHQVPLVHVLRLLHDRHGVSSIVAQGLEDRLVSIECTDVPVSEVMGRLARRFGSTAIISGGLWYFGDLTGEDRAVTVLRVPRLNREDLSAAISAQMGQTGRSWVGDDGIVVVSDTVDGLQRIHRFASQLALLESPTWVLQLYLVTVSESRAKSWGLDLDHLVSYSATYASGSMIAGAAGLSVGLDSVLFAASSSTDTHIQARPLLLVSDGERAIMSSGRVVPVPRRSVSPETGQAIVVGYDEVTIGLDVDVTVRETSLQTARLTLDVRQSQLLELVADEVPVTLRDAIRTTAIIRSGGVYLLGSLDSYRTSDTSSGPIIHTAQQTDATRSSTLVWARVYRIAGPSGE